MGKAELAAHEKAEIVYFRSGEAEIAGHHVRAVRLSHVGEGGWEITCDREAAEPVYDAIRECGARPAGRQGESGLIGIGEQKPRAHAVRQRRVRGVRVEHGGSGTRRQDLPRDTDPQASTPPPQRSADLAQPGRPSRTDSRRPVGLHGCAIPVLAIAQEEPATENNEPTAKQKSDQERQLELHCCSVKENIANQEDILAVSPGLLSILMPMSRLSRCCHRAARMAPPPMM